MQEVITMEGSLDMVEIVVIKDGETYTLKPEYWEMRRAIEQENVFPIKGEIRIEQDENRIRIILEEDKYGKKWMTPVWFRNGKADPFLGGDVDGFAINLEKGEDEYDVIAFIDDSWEGNGKIDIFVKTERKEEDLEDEEGEEVEPYEWDRLYTYSLSRGRHFGETYYKYGSWHYIGEYDHWWTVYDTYPDDEEDGPPLLGVGV